MKIRERPVIGMFDSGMGGISVLGEAVCQMPWADYHYLADVDHVPYGSKSPEQVRGFVDEAAGFLVTQGIDCLVIACNTATSVAAASLRRNYDLPIVGMEPAVKPALALEEPEGRNRIVVTATDMTLGLDKLHSLIDRLQVRDKIDPLSLQGLVAYAEAGDFESTEVRRYLEDRFSALELDRVHSVVLGCTHFNFYKELLADILPEHIHLIDGNAGTVRRMTSFFKGPAYSTEEKAALPKGTVSFYESGRLISGNGEARYLSYLLRACKLGKED